MAEQTRSSTPACSEALEAIVDEHFNDEWNGGSNFTTRRSMDEAVKKAYELGRSTPSESARRLAQKAQVGNTIFDVGIEERLVIDRAIREYEYQHTPEKEAERLERVGEFRKALGVCPKCGTNRFMAACPNGHMAEAMGQCPMVGSAEGPK